MLAWLENGGKVGKRGAPDAPGGFGEDALDLGIPARVFPQWLRCTGCNLLSPVSHSIFEFKNVLKFRPDQAQFIHKDCKGWSAAAKGKGSPTEGSDERPATPVLAE